MFVATKNFFTVHTGCLNVQFLKSTTYFECVRTDKLQDWVNMYIYCMVIIIYSSKIFTVSSRTLSILFITEIKS